VVTARVEIVDSAESTAAKVVDILGSVPSPTPGTLKCFATDSVEKFKRLGEKFLGTSLESVELVDIEK